jgi:lantibiotic biosynthesis protein
MNDKSPPAKKDRALLSATFFAFRTPLLPFDDFIAWSDGLEAEAALDDPERLERALAADRLLLRGRLSALVGQPVIRDALFVASPDLDESLEVWRERPESERGARIERAIVRYFSRMAGRPTPFGLFAGNSVGAIGDRTSLVIEGREKYQRRSRLDMDFLFALVAAVGSDPALRGAFEFRPGSSLYRAAGRVHYVEARLDGKRRTHHLVAAEDSEDLQATLARAAEGARTDALAAALVGDDVSRAEAEEYVAELIDSQILRPALSLFVTGPDPVESLAKQLRENPQTTAIGDRLLEARTALTAIDTVGPGAAPARYRAVARQLEGLGAPVELPRLFQVDMVKPSPEALLGGPVLEEILRGVETLRRLTAPYGSEDLRRFRHAFSGRYEQREVVLVEALDDEAGIGFPPASESDAGESPLLKDVAFPGSLEHGTTWGAPERFLLGKLTDAAARGAREIVLEPGDLARLERKDPLPLPDAFAVYATVAAASEEALSRGNFRLLWTGSDGPSGARPLGRFCDADENLRRAVEEHLRAEEALDPDAVFAEVVHLPEGRLGNVLFRPVLREYEIPYLGRSGASADRQIPISDLLISVSGDRIVLRSRSLGRRVVPRLTSAHNFHWLGMPLYRFLCELQGQGIAGGLGWDWGALGAAPFLPRVVCGRLVLSLAQWNVGKADLKRLSESRGAERFRTVQSWRAKLGLPRLIVLADGDNRLPIDLANALSVESFVHLVKDREQATLIEMFPGPEELCARGPEGRFVHELVVPLVRTAAAGAPHAHPARPMLSELSESRTRVQRSFAPGSEWIYAKLYGGASAADGVLREIVGPLVRESLESGAADRWFFIRYADPDRHIRLRFHGGPAALLGEVLPALSTAVAPLLADGRLWKVQLDTYEREVERYGGPEGIELAERIFQADSEAALEILEMLEEGDEGADERWRLTLRGIDMLLGDFGFALEGKRALLDGIRGELARELHSDESVRRGVGDRFRKESRSLEPLLEPERDETSPLSPGLAVLRGRSDQLAPLIRELKAREQTGRLSQSLAALAPSYIHMHANRLLRTAHRRQELVLYDLLARLYESRAIRTQGSG